MQSTIFEPTNLPELPQPGFINQWVLESPTPLALASLAIVTILFGTLRTTQYAKKIGIPVLAAGLIFAGTLFLVGFFITTDAENLKTKSHALVNAITETDRLSLESLLDEQVRVQTRFTSRSGRVRILDLAQAQVAPIIESAVIKEVRTGLYGPQIARTYIKIKTKGDMIPPLSWWMLDWTRLSPTSDNWVVTHIEPLWIQGITNPAGSK